LAVMISRSASRPKKKSACSSVNGISPAYGQSRMWRRLGLLHQAQASSHGGEVAREIDVENVHGAASPEFLGERRRMPLDRPRLVVEPLLAGDAVQDDAQVPVAQPVAEKQEVALPQLRREAHRDALGTRR